MKLRLPCTAAIPLGTQVISVKGKVDTILKAQYRYMFWDSKRLMSGGSKSGFFQQQPR